MKWLYGLFAFPIIAVAAFMALRPGIPVPENIVFDTNSDVFGYAFVMGANGDQSGILYHTPVRKSYADPLISDLNASISSLDVGIMGVDVFGCFSLADRMCRIVDSVETTRGSMAGIEAVLSCSNGDTLLLSYTYGKGTTTDPDSQSIFAAVLKLDNNLANVIRFSRSTTFQGEPSCGDGDVFSQEVKDSFDAL